MKRLPKHIAIIMDGNGRWAKKRGLPRAEGHRNGVKALKKIVKECGNIGVELLTVYAFSSENWRRPLSEVSFLMKLLRYFAEKERLELHEENVKVQVVGDFSKIPNWASSELVKTIELTKENTGLKLQLALSYSGRDEMIRAIRQMAKDTAQGRLDINEIDESLVSTYLDTAGQPDPDLVIRTSGELRTSNFLIWQSAYSEYYFTPVLWPDFDEKQLHIALDEFNKRERRYGDIKAAQSVSSAVN